MSLRAALCPDAEITPEIQSFLDRDDQPDQWAVKAEAWKRYHAECKANGTKPYVYGVNVFLG